jgi:hypothetical protein
MGPSSPIRAGLSRIFALTESCKGVNDSTRDLISMKARLYTLKAEQALITGLSILLSKKLLNKEKATPDLYLRLKGASKSFRHYEFHRRNYLHIETYLNKITTHKIVLSDLSL